MKKYEFTGETRKIGDITVKRIRAARDFAGVKKGDFGGWIEKEENLSHECNAWVYGDAWVYDDAWVYGGSWKTSPCYINGTRWSVNISSPGTVRIGCQDHTWQEWHDRYQEISSEHNAGDVLEEYIRYFNLLCDMYGHADCRILRVDDEALRGGAEKEGGSREEAQTDLDQLAEKKGWAEWNG